MKRIRYIGFLFLLVSVYSQKADTEKVLFIGNSFTFYFNLPLVVESMAEVKGVDLDVYQSTASGVSLKDHWNGNEGLSTRTFLKQQSFSKVVLQDYSTNPVMNPDESMLYFNKFIDLLNSQGVEIFLYGTWPVPLMIGKSYPGIDPIQEALKPLVSENITVVPVGTAFRLFQKEYPNISLFTSDNKHPSPVGVYLASCVFLKALTGFSSKGLYRRFDRKDENGKKVFLGMVEKTDAEKCQIIADKVEIKNPTN